MNEYECQTPEKLKENLTSIRDQVSTGPMHFWWIGSIDRKLFLIACRISHLEAIRAQCLAETRTLIRIFTFNRSALIEKAMEASAEIESLLQIKTEYEDLKHEIMTYVNEQLQSGVT